MRWLHSRIGISETAEHTPEPAQTPEPVDTPAPAEDLAVAAAVQAAEEYVEAGPSSSPSTSPSTEVEVIPGAHLVANVNGTVIVVAHRERTALTEHSVAAQQLAALAEMVRRTDPQKLVSAFAKLSRQPWTHTLVDVGIVTPTSAGLEILLCGSVTVALDDGDDRTLLHGRGRLVHYSVPMPAVAAVVAVEELGQRSRAGIPANGVYRITGGIVPGDGAVLRSTQTPAAACRRSRRRGPGGGWS